VNGPASRFTLISSEITRAGCWAHARRKLIEAEKAVPEIAREAVEQVRALYAVERQAQELPAAEQLKLRQRSSAPVLAGFREKLLGWKEQLLPKHPMAEAVSYVLGQWEELNVFCSDGAGADRQQRERTRDEAGGAEPQELAVRRQRARRPDGGGPGEPDQQLPAARGGSATVPDAVAGEPAVAARARPAGLAARSVEAKSERAAGPPSDVGAVGFGGLWFT
jgi:hypothetical protein